MLDKDEFTLDRGGPKYKIENGTYEVKLVDISPCMTKWKDDPEKPGYKFTFMLDTDKGLVEINYTTSRSMNDKEGTTISKLVKLLKVFAGSSYQQIKNDNMAILDCLTNAIGKTYLAAIETNESGFANITGITAMPTRKTTNNAAVEHSA